MSVCVVTLTWTEPKTHCISHGSRWWCQSAWDWWGEWGARPGGPHRGRGTPGDPGPRCGDPATKTDINDHYTEIQFGSRESEENTEFSSWWCVLKGWKLFWIEFHEQVLEFYTMSSLWSGAGEFWKGTKTIMTQKFSYFGTTWGRAGAGEMLQHFNLFRKFDRSPTGPICHLSLEQKISLHLLPEFRKK